MRGMDGGRFAIRAAAEIHRHVVDLMVIIEVVIEQKIARLQRAERHMGEGGPLGLSHSGNGFPRLSPRPLDKA